MYEKIRRIADLLLLCNIFSMLTRNKRLLFQRCASTQAYCVERKVPVVINMNIMKKVYHLFNIRQGWLSSNITVNRNHQGPLLIGLLSLQV